MWCRIISFNHQENKRTWQVACLIEFVGNDLHAASQNIPDKWEAVAIKFMHYEYFMDERMYFQNRDTAYKFIETIPIKLVLEIFERLRIETVGAITPRKKNGK